MIFCWLTLSGSNIHKHSSRSINWSTVPASVGGTGVLGTREVRIRQETKGNDGETNWHPIFFKQKVYQSVSENKPESSNITYVLMVFLWFSYGFPMVFPLKPPFFAWQTAWGNQGAVSGTIFDPATPGWAASRDLHQRRGMVFIHYNVGPPSYKWTNYGLWFL